MQSTPNKTSKIPRPGTLSPRVSQGSKSPRGGGSSPEDKSPRVHESALGSSHQEYSILPQLTHGLQDCDWEQLEDEYTDAMKQHSQLEEDLRVETAKLMEVFMVWSQTIVSQDENRALKRLKTQMQHVQNSEVNMENKKKHYTDVVKAFESALALLNDQLKV